MTLGDIFNSLEKGQTTEAPEGSLKKAQAVNTTKLRKQVKALKKEVEKAPVLTAPKSGRKRRKEEMAANYEINKGKVAKYLG